MAIWGCKTNKLKGIDETVKTLFFEGAGCVPRGEVENCRIRTAFTNDAGERIYLEMSGFEVTKRSSKAYKGYSYAGVILHCHYITDGTDDANKHPTGLRNTVFEYTKDAVLAQVNSLNCSFDQVVILPDRAGYRVFKDKQGLNYGDEFTYDAELTARRQEIYLHFDELEKSEGKKYPNFSLWVDEDRTDILHLLRHFEGYNKHWTITITDDGWEAVESKLGKCAC